MPKVVELPLDRFTEGAEEYVWVQLTPFETVRKWLERARELGVKVKRPELRYCCSRKQPNSRRWYKRVYVRQRDWDAVAAAAEQQLKDPRKLSRAQIKRLFPGKFSWRFLMRYSDKWHPVGGKPHPALGRWIRCGTRRKPIDCPPEQWFWLDDLQAIRESRLQPGPATMTALEIAQRAGLKGTAIVYAWQRRCPYADAGRLVACGTAPLTKDRHVRPVKVFPRHTGELVAQRYRKAHPVTTARRVAGGS